MQRALRPKIAPSSQLETSPSFLTCLQHVHEGRRHVPATHTCLCMPSTGHPHAIHVIHTSSACHSCINHTPSTHHLHAIHTSPTCHLHVTHTPSTHHPHAIHMSPTRHPHTTCVAFTHRPHVTLTTSTCHPHVTTHHPHATHTSPGCHLLPSTCHPHTITHYPHTLVYTCPHTQRHHHRGEASERPQVTPTDTLQNLH